jgi:Na+/melibiose symporter-like transporter
MGQSAPRILWLQVMGLAAVQGAISLTWVIYNLYLLDLLTGLGFSASLGAVLLIIENILAAVMEPLMGSVSDRSQRWLGSRFPQIALGLILASVCFVGIPAAFIFGSAVWRGVLLVALVVWALAMTVFRSPALSLLGRYAFDSQLPQAASLLTLVGGLAGAMAPFAGNFILGLGPVVAFTVGSLVLLGAALVLRQVNPSVSVRTIQVQQLANRSQSMMPLLGRLIVNLGLVFVTGMGIALGFRVLLQTFPLILKAQVSLDQPAGIMGLIFLSLALTAIPCGRLASRWGNRPMMVSGLGVMAGISLLLLTTHSGGQAVVFAIATGAAFSLVSNGTLPYALTMVPEDKGGLGTGIYFSGGAVAMSLFGTLTQRFDGLATGTLLGLGSASFALAALCVFLSHRWKQ